MNTDLRTTMVIQAQVDLLVDTAIERGYSVSSAARDRTDDRNQKMEQAL